MCVDFKWWFEEVKRENLHGLAAPHTDDGGDPGSHTLFFCDVNGLPLALSSVPRYSFRLSSSRLCFNVKPWRSGCNLTCCVPSYHVAEAFKSLQQTVTPRSGRKPVTESIQLIFCSHKILIFLLFRLLSPFA